jgi:hypothetical protein
VKKLTLIILLCIIPFNLRSQSIISTPDADPYETILLYRAAKNFIKDSTITILFKPKSPLFPGIDGFAYQISPKMYAIDINYTCKNKQQRKWVILHELGHIIDMTLGNLSQYPPRWMGQKMNNDLPWDIRPWEISADIWAEEMWTALINRPQPYVIFEK